MLKHIIKLSLFAFALNGSALVHAEETQNPLGYELVKPAQPTQHPDKVEIIEFFWYGCPHCYSFEPFLEAWLKKLPKNVEFIRQPAAFNELWSKHAKAYFTAESFGVVDKVHADLFDAIQKREPLESEAQLAKFFVAHGVNESQFHEAYNSFAVDSKLRQAPIAATRYGITGVPAIIVNGKYKTNGTIAGSQEKMIEVMDKLIKEESRH